MANNGITIYAVSMQNEPDWKPDYESCRWTAQQFHDVLSILHDTLAGDSRTANVKIILPEATHWDSLSLVSQVMSDPSNRHTRTSSTPTTRTAITAIADPITGLTGHPIWETEHTGTDPGLGITAGLNEAMNIYHVIGQNQASAYHHWWTNAGGGAGLLGGNWQVTKLYSAMENYSKFIRPSWVMVGETDDNNGLRISATRIRQQGTSLP